jgi:hypothetical protein
VNTADLVNTYFSEKLKYPAKIENYENKKYTKLKKKKCIYLLDQPQPCLQP